MRSLLLLCVFTLAAAWVNPHYQSGVDLGPVRSAEGNHVLQTEINVPRSVDFDVRFDRPFENVPIVALGNSLLEWENNVLIGYTADIVSVSNRGFRLRVTALQPGRLYSVKYNWFATDDPRIKVQYLESDQVGALSAGSGPRNQNFQIPLQFRPGGVQGVAFLIGARFEGGEPQSVNVQTRAVNHQSAVVNIATAGDSRISYVKLCFVATDYNEFLSSNRIGSRPPNTHAWTSGTGERYEEGSLSLPNEWRTGDRAWLHGLTGYETRNANVNTRIYLKPIQLGSRAAANKYGTWGDSRPLEIYYQMFLYKADNLKVFPENCAEVFSQCNYEGDRIQICEHDNNFREHGFTGSVRSLWVPPGRALTLYNRVELEGREVQFTAPQACLNSLDFTML